MYLPVIFMKVKSIKNILPGQPNSLFLLYYWLALFKLTQYLAGNVIFSGIKVAYV